MKQSIIYFRFGVLGDIFIIYHKVKFMLFTYSVIYTCMPIIALYS